MFVKIGNEILNSDHIVRVMTWPDLEQAQAITTEVYADDTGEMCNHAVWFKGERYHKFVDWLLNIAGTVDMEKCWEKRHPQWRAEHEAQPDP